MDTDQRFPLETLQAYQVLCEFCSRMFYASPASEQIEQLIERRDLFLEEPFFDIAPEESRLLHDLLENAQDESLKTEFFTALRQDYTYLFYMVGASHTSPYESVYRTDDRTMFGPTTLEVRALYRSFEMQLAQAESQPDDHIGLELAFLAHLFNLLQNQFGSQEDAEAERTLQVLKDFLSEHLLVFAPTYLANVQTRANTGFYRAIASIAYQTLACMAKAFKIEAATTIDVGAYLLLD
ncbi:MAG: molecular chaperone TorD family protein [Raoultibacter sp.]